ncbi:helix-turn-helix domain-containing protein [Zwartia vadi]|uniref:helix-turn-helix domain-containing protein n=1 Tax=Zwartia vadi TaxID=3058168 RepID=UPI0025B287CE|nr:helix-turn-helix domain-containing protein [Zwartia vadi]MDN3986120.1 helix-turn-helix domain-containing protein [Zwartia vadi]
MYHYTECGLKNVWLTNGYDICEIDGETSVSISDVEELHEVIGRSIAAKSNLSASEIRFLRKELGLSQKRMADLLGSTEQTVSLWERRGRMPKGYDRLIRLLYLEKIDGNVKIQEIINRLIELDFRQSEKLILSDTRSGWRLAA